MKCTPLDWNETTGWNPAVQSMSATSKLLLVFSSATCQATATALHAFHSQYPQTDVIGCSTAGEIAGTSVNEGGIKGMLIEFERTTLKQTSVPIREQFCSYEAGRELARSLASPGLRHVLLCSDGLAVNGSELARGAATQLPPSVALTGGLAADGSRFESTFVIHGDRCEAGLISAVGLYGDALEVAWGSKGGWNIFGPDRIITRSEGNVLFELDGRSALELYRDYLGDYANELPGSALLFPLSIQMPGQDGRVVRTILGIDEDRQSMTFAGDVPEGARAQLMRANFDRLIDGAMGAAHQCRGDQPEGAWDLALLISCVGRRMVLQQRVEEEIEVVRDALGPTTNLFGFYSYGELSPPAGAHDCRLHNQTMTITCLREL